MRRSEEIARRHGLTPRQYLLLLMIGAKEDAAEQATITDLVDRLALTQSTVDGARAARRGSGPGRAPPVAERRPRHVPLADTSGSRRLRAALEEHGPEREHLVRTLRIV